MERAGRARRSRAPLLEAGRKRPLEPGGLNPATPFLDVPDAFTVAECDALRALAERIGLEPATVWSGTADHVDARARDALRCYLPRTDCAWAYDRLDALFAAAGEQFETAVDPLFEDIQFVRYGIGAHFQSWHSDAGTDCYDKRRISASVELSPAADHDGGALEIAPVLGQPRSLPQGGARLFRSRMIHRVTPVTRGVRDALVAWTGVRS